MLLGNSLNIKTVMRILILKMLKSNFLHDNRHANAFVYAKLRLSQTIKSYKLYYVTIPTKKEYKYRKIYV